MKRSLNEVVRRTIVDRIAEIKHEKESVRTYRAIRHVAGIGGLFASRYRKEIDVSVLDGKNARRVALDIARAMKDKGVKGIKVSKSFSSETGKITFAIPAQITGWTWKVSGGDPRCKIKEVTTTETVPARLIEAETMTRKRYVIANPEECGVTS